MLPVNESPGLDATPAPEPRRGDAAQPMENNLQVAGEVRLLILDDDPVICKLIQAALLDHGFTIVAVSEPGSMEATLKKDFYHLIILDYVIPGLPAETMLAWLQKHQPDASIIVVTGYPSVDSALNCLRAHTYDYLTKPFEIAKLKDTILRCLEDKGLLRLSESALRETLGTVIRERRKSLGMTLSQLAQRTNISLGYLSQIELGKNSASIETLYRISLGLGTKMSELFQILQQRT